MVREAELTAYAQRHNLTPVVKTCIYDKASTRAAVREVFALQERLNPEYRYSLWHALLKSGALEQAGDGDGNDDEAPAE